MKSTTIAKGILKAVAIICGAALLLFLIYQARIVIGYLSIAGVIALIGRPLVRFLKQKLNFPGALAALATMLIITGVFIGIIALIVPLLTEQGKNLYMLNIQSIQAEFDKLYQQISEYFGITKTVVEDIAEDTEIEKNVVEGLDRGFVTLFFRSFVEVIGNIGVGIFSVLFISFFFLKDARLIQKAILDLVPDAQRSRILLSLEKIESLLSRYFVGLLLQTSILFAIYSLTLLLAGIEKAMVIAFMCSLFNIIPYVGPLIGAGIMVMLTVTSNLELDFGTVILPKIGYVLVGVTAGQLIDNLFSQPLIFSGSVRSHPLEIFLIILTAGLLFGIVGMMIAVPSYTVIKVILKEIFPNNSIIISLTKKL